MNPSQAKRIFKQSRAIPGWFSKEAALLFAWLDEIQKHHSVRGDCFEIGCHHGKSAVLLGALVDKEQEKLSVCDLFGMQDGNISNSGSGDFDAFKSNLSPLRQEGLNVTVFQKNSMRLTATEIGKTYRIFHVDGGHNPDEALADLLLAADCTVDSGVIILDDPFRSEWPGVTEALVRFLDRRADFQAIMVGFNKLVLVQTKFSDMYLNSLRAPKQREHFGFSYPWRIKEMPFHKSAINVLYVPDYRQAKTLGNLVRRIYHKYDWLNKLGSRKVNNAVIKPAIHSDTRS